MLRGCYIFEVDWLKTVLHLLVRVLSRSVEQVADSLLKLLLLLWGHLLHLFLHLRRQVLPIHAIITSLVVSCWHSLLVSLDARKAICFNFRRGWLGRRKAVLGKSRRLDEYLLQILVSLLFFLRGGQHANLVLANPFLIHWGRHILIIISLFTATDISLSI